MTGTEDSLAEGDRLALSIGRVVQADVGVEWALRFLYQRLCGPSLAATAVPQGFAAVHEACKTMLDMSGLIEPWAGVANGVLTAARQLHERRNRLVHDRFFIFSDDNPEGATQSLVTAHRIRANALRMTATAHDLVELATLHQDFRRVEFRLTVLSFALPNKLPFLFPGPTDGWDEENDLLMASGEFDEVDGGYRARRP